MPDYGTSNQYDLRHLLGTSVGSDIDAGFQALADDVAANMAGYAEGLRADRPTSSIGTPGIAGRLYRCTDSGQVFMDTGTGWLEIASSKGKAIIATEQTRNDAAYGLMTTPDRVQNIVLPTDSLLLVWYQALWAPVAVPSFDQAAVFLGENEIVGASGGDGSPHSLGVSMSGFVDAGEFVALATSSGGLVRSDSDVSYISGAYETTGYLVGLPLGVATPLGGPLSIFAAAGTYDVSVRFKGNVKAKDRRLWVRALAF